jgi:hypothetical protein
VGTDMKKIFSIIFYTFLFISLTTQAHAYLDPGTGSMMLQILIASLVGGLFALKGYWSRIKGFFLNVLLKKKQ